jgi:chemotaxis response regulator CheB
MCLRVLIADDHPLARGALKLLLAAEPVEICGEAENGRQAVQKAKELKPDIVILDILMPDMNGIEAGKEIREIAPDTKLIFMSLYDDETANSANLIGPFVRKTTLIYDLIPTIRNLIESHQGLSSGSGLPGAAIP